MFGFFKKLFVKPSSDTPETAAEAPLSQEQIPPVLDTPSEAPPRAAAAPTARVTPAPVPVPQTPPDVPASAAAPASFEEFRGNCIKIPVSAVLPGVAEELRTKLAACGNRELNVPVVAVVPQLATGSVSLSFGQLRSCTPELLDNLSVNNDCAVPIPLAEVLKRLTPEHYQRRAAQKTVNVSESITALFGPKGQRLGAQPPPAGEPSAKRGSEPAAPAAKAQPSTTRTAPVAAPATPLSGRSLPPLSGHKSASPSPAPPTPRTPMPSMPGNGAVRPIQPAAGAAPSTPLPKMPSSAGHTPPSKPAQAAGLNNRPIAFPASSPDKQPASDTNAIRVPLSEISQGWPKAVLDELAGVDMKNARLALPVVETEQALRTGHIQFLWSQVHAWIEPPLASAPAPAVAEVILDIPLKVVAPLFMARFRPDSNQKKPEISSEIPDLFGKKDGQGWGAIGSSPAPASGHAPATPGHGSAAPVAPTRPVAAVKTAPAAAPIAPSSPLPPPGSLKAKGPGAGPLPKPLVPAPLGAPAPAKPAEPAFDLNAIMGPPSQRFSARDIVANAAKLPGASGALLAMTDGLMVTSALPPQAKGEVVAAFLPQIFGRMGQYTRELNMGGLKGITIAVEGGNWQVVKEASVYLAILCRPDKALPLSHLTAIAAELSKQQQ